MPVTTSTPPVFGSQKLPSECHTMSIKQYMLQEGAAQALRMVHASLSDAGLIPRTAIHAGIGASTLGALVLALYRSEGSLVAGIRQLRKSAVA